MRNATTRRPRPQHRPSARRSPALVESFERRILMAIDVAIGTGTPVNSVTFTDADGTVGVVRVAGGAATVTLDGTGLAQSTTGRAVAVTGTNVAMTNIVITGANPSVTVTGTGTTGNGLLTLPAVSAAGPVRSFSGRQVDFTGAATFSDGIGKLELARAQNATITINRSGQARLQDASATILFIQDTSITSQQPFRQFRTGNWQAGGGRLDELIAPRINVLQSGGDINANLSVSGAGQAVGRPVLGNVLVLGGLNSGTWNVAGKTSRIGVGGVASTWVGTFGDVANFTARGGLSGSLTADSINALNAESMTNAVIRLNRPFAPGARSTALNRLNVRGAVTNADIRANSNIGTVSAASMTGSTIFAGVNAGGGGGGRNLPTAATAFVSAASIRNVTIRNRGTTPAFIDTNIAASDLGRMNLGAVQVSNSGRAFGLAAQTVRSVSALGANATPIRGTQLTEPTESIDATDFEVRVF